MKIRKMAAFPPGGKIVEPPITRERAEQTIGPIPEATWKSICDAFVRHGNRHRALERASKASKKKDDKQGWHARKSHTSKAIESVLKELERAQQEAHGEFLREASDNYAMQTIGRSAINNERADLLI